jgi:LPXTG-site transpeptidase (sortase) family protein
MNEMHNNTTTRPAFGPLVIKTGIVFVVLTLVLVAVDFVPEPATTEAETAIAVVSALPPVEPSITLHNEEEAGVSEPAVPEQVTPVRITVPLIDLDASIVSPESTNIEILDRALLAGAVHYPDSAVLGENGNMLLFGHSSYLPVVKNKAYQAFNDLNKLEPGASIQVHSDTHVHTYTVKQVRLVRAGDAQVAFDSDAPMLTLATCNNFGAKQDRWVVTAEWTGKEAIKWQIQN